MSKSLILGNPTFKKELPEGIGNRYLEVAEFFYDTIQGENNIGFPSAFLRLQGCTLNCQWCCVKGTDILMSDFTYKKIEKVKVGDTVKSYSSKGLIDTVVLNVLQRDNIETVKVITEDGNILHCSSDHRLPYHENMDDPKKIKTKLIPAKDSLGKYIKTFPSFHMKKNVSKAYKRGYIKGVFKGDGSCTDINRLKLECIDYEMIWTCSKYIYDLFFGHVTNIRKIFYKDRNPFFRMTVSKKSINKIIISKPTKKEMIGFISGFFDAEGTFGNDLSISQKDRKVLDIISDYLIENGFKTSITFGSSVWNLRINGGFREHIRFMNLFTPKIQRKFSKIFSKKKIIGGSFVTDIIKDIPQKVYTLTTEHGYYISNNIFSKNCDTKEVWRYGNPYSFDELFEMIENSGLLISFRSGQHLVLTGGSPLRQQMQLFNFLTELEGRYGFLPYIEIENECTIKPIHALAQKIRCWNNSPKLSTSGNPLNARYKPEVLKRLSSYENSWFKFVITNPDDWNEIYDDFIKPGLITYEQVVLMPCGATRLELEERREMVINLAIEHNVRYTTREHIIVWDRKTGV